MIKSQAEPNVDLVDRLIQIQAAHGWSDVDMAARMAMSRPMWSMTKRRVARLGQRSLRGVVRAFPELQEQVFAYLSGETEARAA